MFVLGTGIIKFGRLSRQDRSRLADRRRFLRSRTPESHQDVEMFPFEISTSPMRWSGSESSSKSPDRNPVSNVSNAMATGSDRFSRGLMSVASEC